MASNLKVTLGVIDNATKTLNKVTGEFDKFGKNITSGLKKTAVAGGAAFAGMFAINSLKNQFKSAMDLADGVRKMADQWGMATEEAQKWDYVARMNKTSAQALQGGFSDLAQRIYDAKNGSAENKKAFEDLNVSITDGNGNLRNQNDIIKETVLALSREEDVTKRAALAQKLLGGAGNELATILKQGEGAILDQLDAADKYGQVLSEDTMQKLEMSSDALDTLKQSFTVTSAEIMSNAAPAITFISEKMLDLSKFISEASDTWSRAWEHWFGVVEWEKTGEQVNRIQSEIKEYTEALKDNESIVARMTQLKAKGSWYDPDALEQAKQNITFIKGQIQELNRESQGLVKGTSASNSETESGTGQGATTVSDAQLKRHDKNLQKMYEDTKKWGEEQAKLHWEARQNELDEINNQHEKRREYMYADAQARFEILSESQQLLSDTRISMIESESEREIVLLDQKYDTLRTKAAGNAEALKNIEQSYAIEKNRINDMVLKNQIENSHAGMRAMSGNLETMAGEWKGFAVAYKPIAIAQATWDTYNAANAAYKSMAGIPVVGPGLGIAAATTAIGAGLANVNSIIKTKFASGTMYAPEGWSLVGEQGPELRYITQGTTIYNNRETKQMMNNSNIHVHLYDNNRNQTMELVQQIESGDSDNFIRSIKNRMQII